TLAAVLAQHLAVASFPFGSTLGGLWYGLFPATAASGLVVGTTAALSSLSALTAAFAGVIGDPVQRRLDLHQKRLQRMLDTLEANFLGRSEARFVVRDHYVARLLDLFDALRAVHRFVQ